MRRSIVTCAESSFVRATSQSATNNRVYVQPGLYLAKLVLLLAHSIWGADVVEHHIVNALHGLKKQRNRQSNKLGYITELLTFYEKRNECTVQLTFIFQ